MIPVVTFTAAKSQKLPATFGFSPNVLGGIALDRTGFAASESVWSTGGFYADTDTRLPGLSGSMLDSTTSPKSFFFEGMRSNSIYGSSSKVQPRAAQALIIIKS